MISFVIACYNFIDKLDLCLQSIRAIPIEEKDKEIIVSDDGTAGNEIIEVCKKYNALLIENGRTENLGKVLNAGFKSSKGELIMFLSNDIVVESKDFHFLNLVDFNRYDFVYGHIMDIIEMYGQREMIKRPRWQIVNYDETVLSVYLQKFFLDIRFDMFFEAEPWAVCDGVDAIIKADIAKKYPFSEDFTFFPTHAYVEWLFRLWINNTRFLFNPKMIVRHFHHPRRGSPAEKWAEKNAESDAIYRAKMKEYLKKKLADLRLFR